MMRLRLLNFVSLLHIFGCKAYRHTIDRNDSFYERPLLRYAALRIQVNLTVSFSTKTCCPILNLIANSQDRNKMCMPSDVLEGFAVWTTSTTFALSETANSGKCYIKKDHYVCNIMTTSLYYEPKIPYLTFGFECNREKSLIGLEYEYHVAAKNVTQCESMQFPQNNTDDLKIRCNQFYDFVSFPNAFGDTTQNDALKNLHIAQTILNQKNNTCYKHVDFILCHVLFPRCAESSPDNNSTLRGLITVCEQMCWDFMNACSESLQPLTDFVDCSYYRRTSESDTECKYLQVTCDPPPSIENGQFTIVRNTTHKVGATVQYSCNRGYKLSGNATSTCQFSGLWAPLPSCKSQIHIYIIIAGVILGTVFLLILVLAIFLWKRHKKQKRRKEYFENRPTQQRNREYDAFVSYTYPVSIDFVKNVIHPKLELEANPPFKLLFHTRDFQPATLIYQNILDATRKSNCAIVLMTQEYIDSSWCREEFQEFMEENKRDPAFKVFIILMQPKETLKGYTAYMDKYFRTTTYMTKDDPELWTKITKYLRKLQ